MKCKEKYKDCMDDNSNCPVKALDGEVIQCVDEWAEKKYYYLERYLSATSAARKKYSDNNNAVYIDLFAGPGKCRIRRSQKEILGGLLRVASQEVPFNRVIANDKVTANCEALKKRTNKNVEIYNDDSNVLIDEIVDELLSAKYDKYHFAYLDPFAPSQLSFNIIKRLSNLKRLDILIHFPIGPIRRNYQKWIEADSSPLDTFLGTSMWRQEVKDTSEAKFFQTIISIYFKQLISIGFSEEGLGLFDEDGGRKAASLVTIRNSKSAPLYNLVLVSKNKLATTIWRSIQQYTPAGQKSFNF